MNSYIYLDHAATSPMNGQVIEAMTTAMQEVFGNASSIHKAGREARKYLDDARELLAKSIGAQAGEIIFTSGGTEADNMAILGTVYARANEGKHIITTQVEHHAVLHTCEKLERDGFEVTYLPVDQKGRVAIEDVQKALRDDTILVTIMYGNNEVGTIQPIAEIGALLREHSAIFHTDAVQAYGLESIDVNELQVDLLSVSAHKINGPKGVGFLYQKAGTPLASYALGGAQEKKRRAGTENIPAIIAFATAVQVANELREEKRSLYNHFKQIMLAVFSQEKLAFHVNGDEVDSLPHVLNISFAGMEVESFLVNLDMAGIYVSSGSACTAGSIDPSHVLVAMFGQSAEELRNSIRFSFGQGLTEKDIQDAAEKTAQIVKKLAKK
ncbi:MULTISPECIES: cysteine desulfurase family protein [Lysinibacillus]|jgi:cysteine desulfurase|uniref:cysteine desulfurase n=1 Tax=Lysinibacillus capsici TaxID=2115968 RepID=A0ABY8KKT0_9BACI|nr:MULTISPECIES: cysteine desulfurase family protein [Lysinibacillus]WHP41966.1 cysteine desulfurase family protein [Lysinibacillus boronitolerans]MCM0624368.1 cysteine desulfurase [Lysinibacillus sp. OL1_EC]MCT1537975.1 cysteine desulfurase [Lysinibacillus capsici]MCT1570246.1 cysteine desulfurase [Lysinibacillus capsici]MCT1646636.1 cysteine desulfurase [Lysinibacillus capsici]